MSKLTTSSWLDYSQTEKRLVANHHEDELISVSLHSCSNPVFNSGSESTLLACHIQISIYIHLTALHEVKTSEISRCSRDII